MKFVMQEVGLGKLGLDQHVMENVQFEICMGSG